MLKGKNGVSLLCLAAVSGYESTVRLLLEKGAVYDTVNSLNLKRLEIVLEKSVLKLLSITNKLFGDVKCNNFAEVQNLIKEGAVVNTKNCNSESPLHFAAWKGYDKIVELLLQNKASECGN